jgi:hypothetical protein
VLKKNKRDKRVCVISVELLSLHSVNEKGGSSFLKSEGAAKKKAARREKILVEK